MENYKIAVNFLRIDQQTFQFTVHVLEKDSFNVVNGVTSYRLPNALGVYKNHWVSFAPFEGSVEYECSSGTNHDLTKKFIEYLLIKKAGAIYGNQIQKNKGKFAKGILFYVAEHHEGKEAIEIMPYYFSRDRYFGFLLSYRFINNGAIASRRVQQLSLSLDSRGFSNKDYYIDVLNKLRLFLNSYFDSVLGDLDGGISVIRKFYSLEASVLEERSYVIGGEAIVPNPFLGLKRKENHPYKSIDSDVIFYFLYEKGEREYAKSLLDGLRGRTFPNTFSGIEDFFNISASTEIRADYLNDWSETEILQKIYEIKKIPDNKVIVIALLPGKESADNKVKYYNLKYYFTNNKIPIQIVTKSLISNTRAFEFSVANIALQIFCKLGGLPWKVKPSNEHCLIVGLGQAYSYVFDNGKKEVSKQLAYSVLTDSSGIFKSIEILADSNNKAGYLVELEQSLLRIVDKSMDGFAKIAIHTPFRLNKETLDNLSSKCERLGLELVVLVINDKNDFFGFHTGSNTLVPYESSCVRLSDKDYLIWFEGLKMSNPKASKRIPGPIFISFLHHTIHDFDEAHKRLYLQDCINLSGANWKGFKAKNVPVSMYYCQEIAEFLKNFKEFGLDESQFENSFPWFL